MGRSMSPSKKVERDRNRAQFDPWSASFRRDPFPVFNDLRRHDPVHWSEALHGWVLTRYGDVKTGMNMSTDFVRPLVADYCRRRGEHAEDWIDIGRIMGAWIPFFDMPEHTRYRNLLNQVVNRGSAEAMRARIEQIANGLLEGLVGKEEIDVMGEYAYPLPIKVIGEM